jgi:hypothetical protein
LACFPLFRRSGNIQERRPRLSLHEIAAELAKIGKTTPKGCHIRPSAAKSML